MTDATSEPMLALTSVSKVYCSELLLSSRYALGDFAFPWRLRPQAQLRPLRRKEFLALDNVSLALHPGEVLGVLGDRRSGKSTLAAIAAGMINADSGSVTRHRSLTLVNVITGGMRPMLSLRENLGLRAALYGLPRAEAERLTEEALAFTDTVAEAERLAFNLDPIVIRNAALALALGLRPEVFIFDDGLPMGNMDDETAMRARLEAAFADRSVIIMARSSRLISNYASRCIVLDRGRAVFDGDPAEAIELYQGLAHAVEDDPDEADLDGDEDSSRDQGDELETPAATSAAKSTAEEKLKTPEQLALEAERQAKLEAKMQALAERELRVERKFQKSFAVKPVKVVIDGIDLLGGKVRLVARPGDTLAVEIEVKLEQDFVLRQAYIGLALTDEDPAFIEHRFGFKPTDMAADAVIRIIGQLTMPDLYNGKYRLMLFLPTPESPRRNEFNYIRLALIAIYGSPGDVTGLQLDFDGTASVKA